MTPGQIQGKLKDIGITQKAIAQKLGVSAMTVSYVVNKHVVSDRVMRAVAEAIGQNHREVFPEYYLTPPTRSTSKTAAI